MKSNSFLQLFLTIILCKSVDSQCDNQTTVLLNCLKNENLKLLCICKDISSSNKIKLCKELIKIYFDCHFKSNLSVQFDDYLNTKPISLIDNLCDCLDQDETVTFDLNKKVELERIKLDQRLSEIELNNSIVYHISNYFEAEAKYFILVGFMISLLMISIVWCILYCCQKANSSNLTSSDLFVSSTPINNYSPINSVLNSMPNISPISLHDDQTRTALLDASSMDNQDTKPPSYDELFLNQE